MNIIRSPHEPVDDRVIHFTTSLSVGPEEAFRYFTDPGLLTRWLARQASVEPRVGGRYELFWDLENREDDSTIGCRLTAFVPSELLAFQWRSPVQFKDFANVADPLTHVTVSFHSFPGGTNVHLIHSGWRSTEQWEDARRWQERAWQFGFKQLVEMNMENPSRNEATTAPR